MAITVAKLYQEKFDLLDAEIEERLPAIADGLIIHYPFDGTLNHRININNIYLNLLSYNSHGTTWQMKNNLVNGSLATGTVTVNNSATQEQALTYDMVVCDMYVWGISSAIMATLKSFADAGCVVWCTGNDTLTNVFVQSTAAIGAETVFDGTTFDNVEGYLGPNTNSITVDGASPDPANYISVFNDVDKIIPLYYHNFIGTSGIMGYLYLPNNGNGGSLFFDEFGYVTGFANNRVWLKTLLEFQLGIAKNLITDINTTKNFNWIAIEEATTNFISNPDGSSIHPSYTVPGSYQPGWDNSLHPKAIVVNNWSGGYNGGVSSPEIGYHAQWVYGSRGKEHTHGMMQMIDRNDLYGLGHRWLGIAQNLGTPTSLGLGVGDIISISWWQKSDVLGKGAQVGIYHWRVAEGSYGFETCIQTIYVDKINKWEKVSFTYTITSNWDLATDCHIYVYGYYGNYGTVWLCDTQIEEKSFATAFVNGSRSSGQLSIPNPVKTGEWTINFFCKINTVVGNVQSYNTIFCMGDYYTNNSFTIMDTGQTTVGGIQELIRKGNAGEWAWGGVFTSADNFRNLNMYTIVRNATYYRSYLNGVYLGQIAHLSTTMQDLIHVGSRQGGGYVDSSDFKNLSIYNRALSDPEVMKLAESVLSIKTTKLIVSEVEEIGYKELTPLNYTSWEIGTQGSQGSFSRNGDVEENYIVEDVDPWEKFVPVWEARPDVDSDADGGWVHSSFGIDKTKMYRFSVWIRRTVIGNGNTYSGCYGFGSVNGVLLRADGVTNDTNPYFWAGTWGFPVDKWILIVGHVWPVGSGAGGFHEDSGLYDITGDQVAEIMADFIWRTETTSGGERAYLYYSTLIATRQQFIYPRVDIVNGLELTLDELIKGHDSRGFDKAIEFDGGPATNPLKLKSDLVESTVKINET